jgi:hypothetical protein
MVASEPQKPAKARPLDGVSQHPEDEQHVVGTPQIKYSSGTTPELLALFRLLLREPPADHDFGTCPICKRYGITGI